MAARKLGEEEATNLVLNRPRNFECRAGLCACAGGSRRGRNEPPSSWVNLLHASSGSAGGRNETSRLLAASSWRCSCRSCLRTARANECKRRPPTGRPTRAAPAVGAAAMLRLQRLPAPNRGHIRTIGYRARDVLEISVFQVPDLNKTVQVSDDGNITLPLIGKIRASRQDHEWCRTVHCRAAAQEIPPIAAGQRFCQAIWAKGYRQRRSQVAACLADDGTLTLTQAIASSGGLSDLPQTHRGSMLRALDRTIALWTRCTTLDEIQAGKAAIRRCTGVISW